MPDIGWTELLVIAVLAIVVIGPKDLPRVMRQAGRWMGAARRAANEFRASLEEMAHQADLDEFTKSAEAQGLKRKTDYGDTDPTRPTASTHAPVMTALPPEGGDFRPPAEHGDEPSAQTGAPKPDAA